MMPTHFHSLFKHLQIFLSVLLLSTTCLLSHAEDEEENEESQKKETHYFEIKPAIIANFVSKRLRFVRAEVALKVSGEETLLTIEDNVPLIKHHLIMLISSQLEEEIEGPEGKAMIKEAALEVLLEKLADEGQPNEIDEVLFTSFLIE